MADSFRPTLTLPNQFAATQLLQEIRNRLQFVRELEQSGFLKSLKDELRDFSLLREGFSAAKRRYIERNLAIAK
jgi:hypothetical protein